MAGGIRTLLIKWLSDTSSVEKGSKKASSALGRIGETAAGVFTGQGLQEGAEKLYGFLKDSTEAAMGEQRQQALLAQTMRNTTGAHKEQIEAVEKYITKTAEASGVSKEKLYPAFEQLIRGTHNTAQAQKLLHTAMDVSAGSGRDLGSVSLALTKAVNGNVTGLQRMGIKVKAMVPDAHALASAQDAQKKALQEYSDALSKHGAHSDQARKAYEKLTAANLKVAEAQKKSKSQTMTLNQVMQSLNKTYGGDAAKAADTTAGKMQRLGVQYQEMKVQIGNALLPALAAVADFLLNTLPHAIDVVVLWFQNNWTQIYHYISPFVSFLKSTYTSISLIVKGIIQVFQGLIQFVRAVFTGQWGQAWDGIRKMFAGFWNIIKGYVQQAWAYITLLFRVYIERLGPIVWAGLVAVAQWFWRGILQILAYWALLPVRLNLMMANALWQLVQAAANIGTSMGRALWNGFMGALSGLGGALVALFKGALNSILRLWNSIPHFKMPSFDTHIPFVGKVGGFDVGLPQIPLLASGGITTGSGLAFLHPLEAVVPLKQGLGNTYHITVEVPPMANPAAVGAATVTAIKAYERRNGASWRN